MLRGASWIGYAAALAATAACTLAGMALRPRFDVVNVAMVYLGGVVLVAHRFTRGPAVAASVLGVAAFDLFFVPPEGTFSVDDVQYLLTFAIMLAVALLISGLVESVRRQESARAHLALEAESERIRSTMLASISHDLRTPLAVMTGASSSLAEQGERMNATERVDLARSLARQSAEMSERVGKLLQMTRLEAGAMRAESDWTSIAEVAGAVLARLEARMAQHRLLVEIAQDLPLVRIDAALIEQAIANLLENAAVHTPAGTVVRLRAQQREGELLVSVEDLGGGLAADERERVFEKFHRGHAEGRGSGIGLGLAICKAIVQLHRGRIWAEPLAGGGTAMRFTLPLDRVPEAPREVMDRT
jgi:two-component system sensor histidine kinase KdpD